MADQTNAEVSDERLRELIQRLRDFTTEHLTTSGTHEYDHPEICTEAADELNRRSVTSQASEGEGWQQAVEPFLGLLDPIPVVGDHVEIASLKGDVCDKFVDAALSLTVGEFRALRDASTVSKRVERLETLLTQALHVLDQPEIYTIWPVSALRMEITQALQGGRS